MTWNTAEQEAQMKVVLTEAVGDLDWDDAAASTWTKQAQTHIFNLFKKEGFKVVVLCEAVSKGSGCVKQQYSLISADDCVLQTQITNSKGVMMYALVVATKY